MFFSAIVEVETIKKQYIKVSDAYGCLGVLDLSKGKRNIFVYK